MLPEWTDDLWRFVKLGGRLLSEQSPVLRLDLHERLTLEPLKGRVEDILNLELIPEVEMVSEETQIILRGQMVIRGTYLAEMLSLTAYELEQERPQEEVRDESVSEPFPFLYHIPLEIVLPRERVPEPDKLRLAVTQMDFEMTSPRELEVLAELTVEGVMERPSAPHVSKSDDAVEVSPHPEGPGSERFNLEGQRSQEEWKVQLVAGRVTEGDGPLEAEDPQKRERQELSGEERSETERTGAEQPDEDEFLLVARPQTGQVEKMVEETTEEENEEPRPTELLKLSDLLEGVLAKPELQSYDEGEGLDGVEEEREDLSEVSDGELVNDGDLNTEVADDREPLEESIGDKSPPTVSDYLSAILKRKGEQFTSIRLYRVRESEHLEDVAMQFDVSLEELMRMNRMAQPTFLAEGNLIFIPLKKE